MGALITKGSCGCQKITYDTGFVEFNPTPCPSGARCEHDAQRWNSSLLNWIAEELEHGALDATLVLASILAGDYKIVKEDDEEELYEIQVPVSVRISLNKEEFTFVQLATS